VHINSKGIGKGSPVFGSAGKYEYDNQVPIEVYPPRFGSFDELHTEQYRFLCEECGRRFLVERFDAALVRDSEDGRGSPLP
jgi:hypothetical protein